MLTAIETQKASSNGDMILPASLSGSKAGNIL